MTNREKIHNIMTTDNAKLDIIGQLVKARHHAKLTQADIAEPMKTTASAIARLESGGGKKKHSPSLRTLRAYADALNCDIEMKLVAKKPDGTESER